MVWMTLFHFSFDLSHYGLLTGQNFYTEVFWTAQRTAIVSLFLLCAGMGQGLAHEQQLGWSRFFGRWWRIVACAALVSAGSWWMFPRSWISFGVLHGIAVMLVVVRLIAPPLLARGAGGLGALLMLGALALALPRWIHHPMFDSRWTNWTGLVTRLPLTEDYVPVLPWLGVLLWGVAAGTWVLRQRPAWMAGGLPGLARPLAVLGGWSLSFYMLHQPVLIGGILAWKALAT